MVLYYKLFESNSDTRNQAGGYPQKFRAIQIEYSPVFQNMLMHPKTVLEVLEIVKTIQKNSKCQKKSDFLIFEILLKISFLKHIFISESMLSVIRFAANGFSLKNAAIASDAIFTSQIFKIDPGRAYIQRTQAPTNRICTHKDR